MPASTASRIASMISFLVNGSGIWTAALSLSDLSVEFCWRNWRLESRRVRCFLPQHTPSPRDDCVRRERDCLCGQGRHIQHPPDSFVRTTYQTLLRLRPSVLQCSSRTSLFPGPRCRRANDYDCWPRRQIEEDREAQQDVFPMRECPGRHLRHRWRHHRKGRWRSDDYATRCEE